MSCSFNIRVGPIKITGKEDTKIFTIIPYGQEKKNNRDHSESIGVRSPRGAHRLTCMCVKQQFPSFLTYFPFPFPFIYTTEGHFSTLIFLQYETLAQVAFPPRVPPFHNILKMTFTGLGEGGTRGGNAT